MLHGNQRNHFTKYLDFSANFKREKDRVICEEVLWLCQAVAAQTQLGANVATQAANSAA